MNEPAMNLSKEQTKIEFVPMGFVTKAKVIHERFTPKRHGFSYPYPMHVLNLNELENIKLPLFSLNRFNVLSFFEKDYLSWGDEPLQVRLKKFLSHHNLPSDYDEVYLATNFRFFGFVFNPVSFYFGYKNNELKWLLTEINNTFSEKHIYICEPKQNKNGVYECSAKKVFHVSPFMKIEGDYRFRFKSIKEKLDVSIDIIKEGKPIFISRVWGEILKLSSASHLSILRSFPLTSLKTIPRIYFQAILLWVFRRLPVQQKPNPESTLTIRAESYSWFERAAMHLIVTRLKKINRGSLELVYPDGRQEIFGNTHSKGYHAHIRLNNFNVFKKSIMGGAIALGESYVEKDYDSNNIGDLLSLLLDNYEFLNESKVQLLKPLRFFEWIRQGFRKNTIRGSRKNIQAHYDLGNDLFKSFLDETLTYSSAIFSHPEQSLKDAQLNKIHTILKKANLSHDDHLLEIGSGWGTLAIEAARLYGCKVTSITVSEEQLKLAQERVKEAGMENKVEIIFQDYRTLTGTFSKIISVEMLEAVGKEYLDTFFKVCNERLSRDGTAVLQVITYPDQHYEEYLTRADWIQKYIFPGSHLPSLTAMLTSLNKNTSLIVDNIENIGNSYAKTLKIWRKDFIKSFPSLKDNGYDERFKRTWEYYLGSCEAEFGTRWLSVLQLVLVRPNNRERQERP